MSGFDKYLRCRKSPASDDVDAVAHSEKVSVGVQGLLWGVGDRNLSLCNRFILALVDIHGHNKKQGVLAF